MLLFRQRVQTIFLHGRLGGGFVRAIPQKHDDLRLFRVRAAGSRHIDVHAAVIARLRLDAVLRHIRAFLRTFDLLQHQTSSEGRNAVISFIVSFTSVAPPFVLRILFLCSLYAAPFPQPFRFPASDTVS